MAVSRCLVQSKKHIITDTPQNVDYSLKESVFHGTAAFPVAIYHDDIQAEEVMWHWHEEFEIGFITNGDVLLEAGTRKYVLHPGDGFFINSGVIHAAKNASPGSPSALKSIVFHSSVISGMRGSLYDQKYVLPIIQNRNMRDYILYTGEQSDSKMLFLMKEIWTAMFSEEEDYTLCVRYNLSRLFSMLINRHEESFVSDHSYDLVRENRAQTMLEFIHRKYTESITLTDIAAEASVSVSEALRCFNQIIGLTPIQYLKKYRLSRAAQLLKETDYSISKICELCGFQDNSYFAKSFREVYHSSPHSYRCSANKE